jgi:superfamily I DNA/RNA helicase
LGTVSLLNGNEPILHPFDNETQQAKFVAEEICKLIGQGISANEIGIFSRKKYLLKPIEKALAERKVSCIRLDDQEDGSPEAVITGSMHRAKGLEFKVVFVVNVSDNVIPLPQSLAETDPKAYQEALEQEKHLLYVSVTRARDAVYLCWIGQPSRYLSGECKKVGRSHQSLSSPTNAQNLP